MQASSQVCEWLIGSVQCWCALSVPCPSTQRLREPVVALLSSLPLSLPLSRALTQGIQHWAERAAAAAARGLSNDRPLSGAAPDNALPLESIPGVLEAGWATEKCPPW
jgi:hypothetical protein